VSFRLRREDGRPDLERLVEGARLRGVDADCPLAVVRDLAGALRRDDGRVDVVT
jgi:hypothetical protein